MRNGAPIVAAAVLALAACGVAPPTEVARPPSAVPLPSPTATALADEAETTTPAATAEVAAAEATGVGWIELPPDATVMMHSSASTTDMTLEGSFPVEEMLLVLNQRRAEHGCPALLLDERLQTAAQAHADDLFARQAIDHVGADGATLEQRLQRVGYPFQRRSEVISRAHSVGALVVVDQWLAEPPDGPHRTSVLGCYYADAGIGWRETTDGVAYWVVDLGEPR